MAHDKKLSQDDRILWGKVTRTTRPMPGRSRELEKLQEELLSLQREMETAMPAPSPAKRALKEVAKTPSPAVDHRHHPLERPVKRKLAKGRLPIEARIDLHGLYQAEAHAMLHGFLVKAHERGLRHVLVITGKGSSLGSEGALRRAVPMWFAMPDFRHLISSYESSAQNHGGEGALYVRLARKRG